MTELLSIELGKIRVNPVALRDVNRQSEAFLELVDSVRSQGVLNAINVRRKAGEDGKEFELVDGLQRFTASQEAGLQSIPAQVLERDDADALLAQVIGNAHRIETKPVEYARGLMRILGYNPTMTESELAAKLAKSPSWINKQLGLLKLADAVKPLVNEGKIPLANAFALAKLPAEEQVNWVERAQTMEAAQFGPAALERVKQIRDANRQGRAPQPEEFVPVAHLRKKTDIEAEMLKPVVGPALISELDLVGKAADKLDAATQGFILGLQWSLNYDPKSIEIAKQKDAERRQRDAEAKARREQERKEKRAKEVAEKEAAAAAEASKVAAAQA